MPRRNHNQQKPLPGFPREEKFKSKEEVDSYFAGERIQCLLCGRWLKWLNPLHLRNIHGISTDDYKEMYGLPWKRGLLGTVSRKNRAKAAKQLRAEGKLKNPSKEVRKEYRSRKRPIQPFERDKNVKRGLALHGKTMKYRREDHERILERIRNENRMLKDVCRDPDLPSKTSWQAYVKTHPDFNDQIRKIYHSLPYPLQARALDLSPRFSIDCQLLWARGESVTNIAAALGVSNLIVRRVLKESSTDSQGYKPKVGPVGWKIEDFESILDRMRSQQRTLKDLCGDPDLPSLCAFNLFIRKNTEFKNKIREIRHNMPYHLQAKTGFLSPRFAIDCLRLRVKGMSIEEIGIALGVSTGPVSRILRDNPDSRLSAAGNRIKKWRQKDFEAIFERMRSRQKTLREACGDKDLPSIQSWIKYKKKHPEIVEKYLHVLWSLPIHVQLKTRTLSPELLTRVQRMRSRGMTQKEIAAELGVDIRAVERIAMNIRKDKSKALEI